MIHNPYLSLGFVSVLGWSSWLLVLHKLSPFRDGALSLGLFYASLLIALTGTLALVLYQWRMFRGKPEQAGAYFTTALREGFLLSLMLGGTLIFQRLRVLTWWDAFLLLAIVVLLEFYFLARD